MNIAAIAPQQLCSTVRLDSTERGIYESSDSHSETCRCQRTIFINHKPSGLLPTANLLQDLLLDVCGTCEAFERPNIQFSTTRSSDFTFPVAQSRGAPASNGDGGRFLPIIDVPGIALVRKRPAVPQSYAFVVQESLADSWPVFALSSVMAVLAGIVMWVLVS